jgi:hypothetical protein
MARYAPSAKWLGSGFNLGADDRDVALQRSVRRWRYGPSSSFRRRHSRAKRCLSAPASLGSPSAIPVVAGGAVMACLILRFTRTLGTARLPSWAETCEVNTAKLVCNLAARKPWPHPKGTGAAEAGKHPVEIGHDEIEVRFAPMSRRLGVDPDVHPGLYFPAYFGNSAPVV